MRWIQPEDPTTEELEWFYKKVERFPKPLKEFIGLGFVSSRRLIRVEKVLDKRSKGVRFVLCKIDDPHNQAAVMRTAEGLGIHFIDIVNVLNFAPNVGVTQSADKWIEVNFYKDSISLLNRLKMLGYTNIATVVTPNAVDFRSVDWSKNCAIWIGNEAEGLPDEISNRCDIKVTIPMFGFTRSFNVSVAAAIIASYAIFKRESMGLVGDISEVEKMVLRIEWYKKISPPLPKELEEQLTTIQRSYLNEATRAEK